MRVSMTYGIIFAKENEMTNFKLILPEPLIVYFVISYTSRSPVSYLKSVKPGFQ